MFLLELDIKTGLIEENPPSSGWRGIKRFRDLYDKKGIKALTVIALTCDYLSVFSNYKTADRFQRALEEIYGKRTALKIDDDLIVQAMEAYNELQFDPDLEQKRINNDIKLRLLNKIAEANKKEDDAEIGRLTLQLHKHEESLAKFNLRFNKKEAIARSVTGNGYELTRIENDIKARKNSKFLSNGEDFENPNQLGISAQF